MPNFEAFSKDKLPHRVAPRVTVQKRGSLSLNRSAYDALGSPAAVELLYDRDASIIGLRATESTSTNACYVRSRARERGGPWLVSAMAFLKYYGVDTVKTRRWAAYLDDDVLCVDLSGAPESE